MKQQKKFDEFFQQTEVLQEGPVLQAIGQAGKALAGKVASTVATKVVGADIVNVFKQELAKTKQASTAALAQIQKSAPAASALAQATYANVLKGMTGTIANSIKQQVSAVTKAVSAAAAKDPNAGATFLGQGVTPTAFVTQLLKVAMAEAIATAETQTVPPAQPTPAPAAAAAPVAGAAAPVTNAAAVPANSA